MWCLVSQANSVILEVQVDPKAIGQECLEKVSHFIIFFIYLFNKGNIIIIELYISFSKIKMYNNCFLYLI